MKKRNHSGAGILCLLLVLTTQAERISLSTRHNGADTSLQEHAPDSGQDASVLDLRSRAVAGSFRHNAVALRFDLPFTNITDASLKFCVVTNSAMPVAETDGFEIDIYGVVDGTEKGSLNEADWVESTVAYNTMPGISGSDYPDIDRDHAAGATTYLGTIHYAGGVLGEIGMTTTPELVDFLNADTDGAVTFLLEAQTAANGQDFNLYIASNKNSLQAGQFYPTLMITAVRPICFNTKDDGADSSLLEHVPDSGQDADVLDLRSRAVAGSLRHNAVALRFDMNLSSSATITEASLAFCVVTNSAMPVAETDGFEIDVYGVVDGTEKGSLSEADWVESTVAYNTMPGISGSDYPDIDRDHAAGATTYLGTIHYPGGVLGKIGMASTSELLDFLNADTDGAVTFLLEAQIATGNQDFNIYIRSNKNSISGGQFYPTLNIDNYMIDEGVLPWPTVLDETTGKLVYQLTSRSGNNMAFYYLFKNRGAVGGTPYLAYRNADSNGIAYYSINLDTGMELQLTPRAMVGSIADVQGEYMYCMAKARQSDSFYSYLNRYHLESGGEERIINLDTNHQYSANLTVNADGTKVLYFHQGEDAETIELMCGTIPDGTQQVLASGQRMSHIQFGPIDPDMYTYLDKNHYRHWQMIGVGWTDFSGGFVTNTLLNPSDSFFQTYDGQLVASHPYWDAGGALVVDCVDTSSPYTNEYNIRFEPDRDHLGELAGYQKVQIEMGEFQTHFNPGPSTDWFVGDGEAADWSFRPGFGTPYIHKLHYDYATEQMTQIPLADQVGAYWKTGEYEPNARYVPGKDLVVWNAFRTLGGDVPDFATGGAESDEWWLYSSSNNIKQNVFAVLFSDAPAVVMGWSAVSGNLIRMVVNTPDAANLYYPKTTMNLMDGTWTGVAHSDDGVNAFITTNLGYSTVDTSGTNKVIYVQADDAAGFFGIGEQ